MGYKGDTIDSPKYADIRKTMLANMLKVLDVEKFMPVMTPEELRGFEQIVSGRKKADFSPLLLEQWQERIQERQDNINEKFTAATAKSEEICKQRKAKK